MGVPSLWVAVALDPGSPDTRPAQFGADQPQARLALLTHAHTVSSWVRWSECGLCAGGGGLEDLIHGPWIRIDPDSPKTEPDTEAGRQSG